MRINWKSLPGRVLENAYETATIGWNLASELKDWTLHVNRLGIQRYVARHFPDVDAELDGGDRSIMTSFLDPDAPSNTFSILALDDSFSGISEYRELRNEGIGLLSDGFGREAYNDTSFAERSEKATVGPERWFFINGILTSAGLARANVRALEDMFGRDFTLIRNPTHGLVRDLVESALQKFANINTEPVARAFVEIGQALCDPKVEKVMVVGHSQGSIITGDVLDLVYASLGDEYLGRTNMTPEEVRQFMETSFGTVPYTLVQEVSRKLRKEGKDVVRKLELYMFANAASRMCYLEAEQPYPHIESYANEHDIIARLGSLGADVLHQQDLLHIDGSLFTRKRYGHLLNAHYLDGFSQGLYEHCGGSSGPCVGQSVHEPVEGNPCTKHPDYVPGPVEPRLATYLKSRSERSGASADPGDHAPDVRA